MKKFAKTETPNAKIVNRSSRELSLYVWTDFSPDYTGGLAVALASSQTEAESLIIKNRGYSVSQWGTLNVYPLNAPRAFVVPGGG